MVDGNDFACLLRAEQRAPLIRLEEELVAPAAQVGKVLPVREPVEQLQRGHDLAVIPRHLEEEQPATRTEQRPDARERARDVFCIVQDVARDDEVERVRDQALAMEVLIDIERLILQAAAVREAYPALVEEERRDIADHILEGCIGEGFEDALSRAALAGSQLEHAQRSARFNGVRDHTCSRGGDAVGPAVEEGMLVEIPGQARRSSWEQQLQRIGCSAQNARQLSCARAEIRQYLGRLRLRRLFCQLLPRALELIRVDRPGRLHAASATHRHEAVRGQLGDPAANQPPVLRKDTESRQLRVDIRSVALVREQADGRERKQHGVERDSIQFAHLTEVGLDVDAAQNLGTRCGGRALHGLGLGLQAQGVCHHGGRDGERRQPAIEGRGSVDDGRGLGDRGMRVERCIQLRKLDTVSADLDLGVFAAQELDVAVRQVAAEVPRAIEALGCARMDDEALGRLRRVSEVAGGETGASDVQLAGHPVRTVLQPPIQDMEALIGERLAVRNAAPVRRRLANWKEDRPDGRFGRTAQAHQLGVGNQGTHACRQARRYPVAAQQNHAQARKRLRTLRARQPVKHLQTRRYGIPDRDSVLAHQLSPVRGIGLSVGVRDHDSGPAAEQAEDIEDRQIEAQMRECDCAIGRPNVEATANIEHRVQRASMRDHHTLRHPSGAGCVDHVRKCVRIGAARHYRRPGPSREVIDRKTGDVRHIADRGCKGRMRDHILACRVPKNARGAGGWLRHIDGNVRGARDQGAHDCGDLFRAALEHDRDEISLGASGTHQCRSNALRPLKQLAVTDHGTFAEDGRARRLGGGLFDEGILQQLGGKRRRGRVHERAPPQL